MAAHSWQNKSVRAMAAGLTKFAFGCFINEQPVQVRCKIHRVAAAINPPMILLDFGSSDNVARDVPRC